jgi:hypothetical protein
VAAHASIASDGAVGILPAVRPSLTLRNRDGVNHTNGRGQRPLPWGLEALGPERVGGWRRVRPRCLVGPKALGPQEPIPYAPLPLTPHLSPLTKGTLSWGAEWLNAGLKRGRENDDFIRRLDTLDHAISSQEPDTAPMRVELSALVLGTFPRCPRECCEQCLLHGLPGSIDVPLDAGPQEWCHVGSKDRVP